MLGRIWTEADLLVAECLRRGVWDGLAPAELAAAVSVVLYEARREGDERASVPRGRSTAAVDACAKLWAEIEADEAEHGLALTREPDLGFVWPMYRWARGRAAGQGAGQRPQLDARHAGRRLRPLGAAGARPARPAHGGVRRASPGLRETARKAITAVNRGVLAYQTGL